MSLVVDRPPPAVSGGPEQGVIDDARRRQRSRRRRVAALVIGLFVVGAVAAGAIEGGGSDSSTTRDSGAARIAAIRARLFGLRGPARLSPALEGGQYGWCVKVGGGGGCPTLPSASSRLQGSLAFSSGTAHEATLMAVLSPAVASVLVGKRRIPVVSIRTLPGEHLRIASITIPLPDREYTGIEDASSSIVALNARGQALHPAPAAKPPVFKATWWKRPDPIPRGPCQIHVAGLPQLQPEWGHVAQAIRPYPGKVVGRAFYSCISVEYYLHKWPLIAAVLLDAEHPGKSPGQIPELTPVAGAGGFFNGGRGWSGEETALRSGNHWLVVEGGSGVEQRLEVLRHLRATVRL